MWTRVLAAVMGSVMLLTAAPSVRAEEPAIADTEEITPARLSYAQGGVTFWRPGAEAWEAAAVNTPLAEGDELVTARDGTLELQVAGAAFVRAWGDTRLALAEHEPGLVRVNVPSGHVSVDLRSIEPGRVLQLSTPNAALTIDRPGYYRVDVTADRATFLARRDGRATLSLAAGGTVALAPDQALRLDAGGVRRVAVPDLDVWDRWNATRTDSLLAAASARYVPSQVAGVSELDQYGTWREVPTYGAVWTPARVAADWAPYSTGRWIHDPRFGWTWVDVAPWGWAPYHYGRWVVIDGVWAWAPGPRVVRPVYAPALVAFFGAPGVHITWCALGWGEPVVPWWGRSGFVGRPWWGGWGGPRVTHVTVHRNVTVVNAVVGVRRDHFGRGNVATARVRDIDVRRLEPVRGRLGVRRDEDRDNDRRGDTNRRTAVRPPDVRQPRPAIDTRPDRRPETPRVDATPRVEVMPRTVPKQPPVVNDRDDRARRPETPRVDTTPRVEVMPRTVPKQPPVVNDRDDRARRPETPRVDTTPRVEVMPRTVPKQPPVATPAQPTPSAQPTPPARPTPSVQATPPVRVAPRVGVTPQVQRNEPARAAGPARGAEPKRAAAHPDRGRDDARPGASQGRGQQQHR